VSWRPRTCVSSIFVESRKRLLFANWPEYQEPYADAADLVKKSSCRSVGIVIDLYGKECLLWSVLGAPNDGMRPEVSDPISASLKYGDPTLEPFALVCAICGEDRAAWDGLPLVGEFDVVQVFARQ
jgi:hypothetical protein